MAYLRKEWQILCDWSLVSGGLCQVWEKRRDKTRVKLTSDIE